MKIRKGDKVKVTTGKNTGTVGTVLSVNTKKNTVIVDGVNVKKRAVKKSDTNNESYIYLQHGVHVSNVRLVDENGAYTKVRVAQPVEEKKPVTEKKSKTVKSEKKTKSTAKAK